MRVSDFHFDLPEELIAQHPPATRGSSRMLILHRKGVETSAPQPALTDDLFVNLPSYLRPGDLLVLNDSRVLPARLFATRAGLATQHNSPHPTGHVEVLLTEQVESQAFGENIWKALVKPARKIQPGETLHFYDNPSTATQNSVILSEGASAPESSAGGNATAPRISSVIASKSEPILTAEVLAAGEFGERTLRFAPVPDFYDRIDRIGHMPLPPYIHRDQAAAPDSPEDKDRYQTVYSQKAGSQKPGSQKPESQKAGSQTHDAQPPSSAAAPTAGLHFTPEILAALEARGVEIAYLTLHVGLGTFQPVRVSELADIRLHAERYTLPPATAAALNRALREGRRILAVGTTTTRTLEHIGQAHTAARSTQRTTYNVQRTTLHPHSGQTSIFLAPGHHFRIVSGLLTNFHLPESTLLMLAAAFAGDLYRSTAANSGAPCLDPETWGKPPQTGPNQNLPMYPDHGRQTILAAYAHAIAHGYRFYSYGDCMLIL